MLMFRASVRLCASLYKRRVSISLRSGERFVREVDSVDSILRGTGVSLLLSRGPLSSSLSSTWGNDTRAGPPYDSYETLLSFSLSFSYSAPVTPPSSILFDYSVMGEKKVSATGGGGRGRRRRRERGRDKREARGGSL